MRIFKSQFTCPYQPNPSSGSVTDMDSESFVSNMKEAKEKLDKKKVMVAIDENRCSYYALMWVLDNLKDSIKNLELVIFAAQPSPNYNFSFSAPFGFARLYSVSDTSGMISSVHEQNKKVLLGILEKARGICASRGVNAETTIEVGDPKEAICIAIKKHEIDLLVIGDYADGSFEKGNYCLKNAKCPVLVVKKPESNRA